MLPESADQQRKPREQRRLQAQENRKAAANQHNPTMHPATRAGKIRRFLTLLPGRRVNAPPLRKCSHILPRTTKCLEAAPTGSPAAH